MHSPSHVINSFVLLGSAALGHFYCGIIRSGEELMSCEPHTMWWTGRIIVSSAIRFPAADGYWGSIDFGVSAQALTVSGVGDRGHQARGRGAFRARGLAAVRFSKWEGWLQQSRALDDEGDFVLEVMSFETWLQKSYLEVPPKKGVPGSLYSSEQKGLPRGSRAQRLEVLSRDRLIGGGTEDLKIYQVTDVSRGRQTSSSQQPFQLVHASRGLAGERRGPHRLLAALL